MRARLVGASLTGGLLCTLLDQVHVRTGTLYYPRPDVFGQAWWVLPLFTGSTLACALAYPVGARLSGDTRDLAPRRDHWGTRELLASLAWFSGGYALTGVCNRHPVFLTAWLLGTFVARMAADGSRALLLNALSLAAVGTGVEYTLNRMGLFHYRVPGAFGLVPVPVWLPGIYLHAAFAVRAALRRGVA